LRILYAQRFLFGWRRAASGTTIPTCASTASRPKAARDARVEGVEKVILCYIDAIETRF